VYFGRFVKFQADVLSPFSRLPVGVPTALVPVISSYTHNYERSGKKIGLQANNSVTTQVTLSFYHGNSAPSDYYLFPGLKQNLWRRPFKDGGEVLTLLTRCCKILICLVCIVASLKLSCL